MKLKGIVLVVILLLASIMMPFNVYASEQSSIAPTFSSSTSQWNGHLHVTNFSDGTNTQASSTLSFTFDDDYYGIVYFDGYGPNNLHIANFASCYVAGGYGEWRYSVYQNGVINITSVTIQIVNVVKPQTTVDLTQIITLLTAIENDTSSIDNVLDTTLAQIRLVLAELIESNGYLEILTKVRDFNVYFESYPFIIDVFRNNNFTYVNLANFYNLNYPIFSCSANTYISSSRVYRGNNAYVRIIFGTSRVFNQNNFSSSFYSNFDLVEFIELNNYATFRIYSLKFQNKTGSVTDFKLQTLNAIDTFIPIYLNPEEYTNISTDFALLFGLRNQLLDDIHLIANGTNQSSSAASDLESGNSQMADDMDDLATIESGYNQQFNNQLQSIDFTSPIQNNAGILPAANFVISIFNGLINNNPFSVLIIIVCILLIGKKVIGK